MAEVLGWSDATVAREVEHYRARVAAERASQGQPDDLAADAARLGAAEVRRSACQPGPVSGSSRRRPAWLAARTRSWARSFRAGRCIVATETAVVSVHGEPTASARVRDRAPSGTPKRAVGAPAKQEVGSSTSPSTSGGCPPTRRRCPSYVNRRRRWRRRSSPSAGGCRTLPKRVRTLEERLLDTKGQLAQAVAHNEKLSYTLREAREQISALREEVEKLTRPPSAYGTYLGRNDDDGTVDVFSGGRKMRVALHPDIDTETLDGAPRSCSTSR